MDYSIGTSVLENWRIVRFLGEGANGKVFEIHKTDHGVTTKSALKVMRVPRSEADIRAAISEGMDQRSVTTYFQGVVDEIVKEIALMAELKSHPAIVSCEDYQVIDHPGEIGWDILIRMELLTALPDYQMNSPLGQADVLRMGRELCGALVLCQKKGMIHRDVKPENIFVSEFGQFKLGDFGVARTVEKTTGGLSKKGTESYMAPEVYLGRPYGGSVDIYSLGLVLYKFLNKGRLPFFPAWPSPITFADRENALSARMQGKTFPHPCDASDSFARVILKACAYDPKERYRTAAEFLEALNQVEIPQNAGKADASGSFAGTSEFHADEEKTMGMYGGSDAEEKTVGMYGNQDAEDKTVGMYGSSSPEAEEKTVGMYGSSDAEEKTIGMYGSGSPVVEENTSGIAGNTAASRSESEESARQTSQPPEQEKPIKKTRKTAPWIVAAVATIVIIAIVVFMQSNKKYQVTVANGSGAGAYKAGEEVALIAEDRSAEDLEFSGWEVIEGEITLGDAAEKCSFVMPKSDIDVRALYRPKKHYVKVIDGEGEGEYVAGGKVTLTAADRSAEDLVFTGWEVTKGEVSLSDAALETCSFIMPRSDVEISAVYKEKLQIEWENVIDRLMEPEAWMSKDGKINYAEFSLKDLDTYQANYHLAVEENGEYIMPVLPVKEYREKYAIDCTELYIYDMLDNDDFYSIIHIYWNGAHTNCILFGQPFYSEVWKKVRLTDPSHWKNGLYPKCEGIYLAERYENVLEQLGITEEMLNWVPSLSGNAQVKAQMKAQMVDEVRSQNFNDYAVEVAESLEQAKYISLTKESRKIAMNFGYNEGNSHYYLDWLTLSLE